MQIGWSTLGFASGTVATTVVAVSVMSLNSQQVRDNAFHVCVAQDRVLRLVETDEQCPEGQQRLRLQEADVPDVDPPKEAADMGDRKKGQDQPANESTAKKADDPLELADFKKVPSQPAVTKVKAPFEVVDANGRIIMRVDSSFGGSYRGLGIYDTATQANPVAYVLSSTKGDGILRAESPSGQVVGVITASEERVAALFGKEGQGGAAMIGTTPSGRGIVEVGNGETAHAAMVSRLDDRGQIQVNSGAVNVVTITEGSQGGMLQIADKGGRTMVEAGIDPGDGVGVVRAGPKSGPGYMVGPAILVSRIVGKQ